MKAGGGKAKGSQFERDICVQLSLWVSKGKHRDLFWRSAMSGGRATVARAKGVNIRQAGDICAVAPEGHPLCDAFYIECKFYANLAIESFILKDRGRLAKFWATARKIADQRGVAPMLIAKQNLRPTLLITRPLRPECHVSLEPAVVRINRWGGKQVEIREFDSFLACVRPQKFKRLANHEVTDDDEA